MRTPICESLDIEFPIFAFSHCRDVVAAVSAAGGFGVLGASRHSPADLAIDLEWIHEHSRRKPFGVDLVFPVTAAKKSDQNNDDGNADLFFDDGIPEGHRDFVESLAVRFDISAPSDVDSGRLYSAQNLTEEHMSALWEVARDGRVAALVSALGPAPADIRAEAHDRGVLIGGLVGSPRHARHHVDAGADFVVAQGSEAGGHVGQLSTMVLVPQVVDEVGAVPVLAAGGIADGRQVAAAMSLGAQGVWIGSLWLTTVESDLQDGLKNKLLAATSNETVVSRCYSGKPVRLYDSPWVRAWSAPDAPEPLPTPLQGRLVRDLMVSMSEHSRSDIQTTPVGQVLGMMNEQRSASGEVMRLVEEFIDSTAALAAMAGD